MIEKIYGVYGLMEWDALIVCGKARLRVRFEGGTSSGYGESPAVYRTSNAAAQHIIESSRYFRENRIRLLRVMDSPGQSSSQFGTHPAVNPAEDTAPAEKLPDEDSPSPLFLEDRKFNDPQAARRFIHETYGVPLEKMMNTDDIKAAGQVYGFNLIW